LRSSGRAARGSRALGRQRATVRSGPRRLGVSTARGGRREMWSIAALWVICSSQARNDASTGSARDGGRRAGTRLADVLGLVAAAIRRRRARPRRDGARRAPRTHARSPRGSPARCVVGVGRRAWTHVAAHAWSLPPPAGRCKPTRSPPTGTGGARKGFVRSQHRAHSVKQRPREDGPSPRAAFRRPVSRVPSSPGAAPYATPWQHLTNAHRLRLAAPERVHQDRALFERYLDRATPSTASCWSSASCRSRASSPAATSAPRSRSTTSSRSRAWAS
jgi:hypothetical protein